SPADITSVRMPCLHSGDLRSGCWPHPALYQPEPGPLRQEGSFVICMQQMMNEEGVTVNSRYVMTNEVHSRAPGARARHGTRARHRAGGGPAVSARRAARSPR